MGKKKGKGKGKRADDDEEWAGVDAAHALAVELAMTCLGGSESAQVDAETGPAAGTPPPPLLQPTLLKKKKKDKRRATASQTCPSCTFANQPGVTECVVCDERLPPWNDPKAEDMNIIFSSLPLDIWEHIFGIGVLSPNDLAALSRVCKMGYKTAHAITTMKAAQAAHLNANTLNTLFPQIQPASMLVRCFPSFSSCFYLSSSPPLHSFSLALFSTVHVDGEGSLRSSWRCMFPSSHFHVNNSLLV